MLKKIITVLIFVIGVISFPFDSKEFNSPQAVIYNTNKKMPANFRFEMNGDNWEDTNYIIHVLKDGDKYVNTETGDVFVKNNGTWEKEGNIKGPKGDKGAQGVPDFYCEGKIPRVLLFSSTRRKI